MAVLSPPETEEQFTQGSGRSRRGIQVRLFLTCWLIYLLHFSPFVVRELYLTISLAEKRSVRVDEYVDLHPDLFVLPGRGSFMGGNPGVSILSAVPYWLALPVVNRVAPARSPRPGERVSAEYREQRPSRVSFYKKAREKGLEVRLGLAGMITSVFFMAPLAALSSVVMFRLLADLGFPEKGSLWLTWLYAFGTPIFFRAATLSQNLLVTLLGLFSFVLLRRARGQRLGNPAGPYFAAGLLAGWAVLSDYTGVVTVSVLGVFALAQQMKTRPFWAALKSSLWFVAGAAGPIAFLFFYQWYCYGNPWLPVQFHQPQKQYLGYPSERGVGWPLPAALWGLLFDPLYGLLVFAPILALAFYHLVLTGRRQNLVPSQVAYFSWAFFGVLWVFCSCLHYTVRHQWQEGVRYMVPAVPFLFLLVADVLIHVPRVLAGVAGLAAVWETWCLAMVRENPLESLARVLLHGFELPWLTTLVKTAPQSFPSLADGASPLALFVLWAAIIWGIWGIRGPWRAANSK